MNRRILIVDDQLNLHEDYRKALLPQSPGSTALADAKAAFFGEAEAAPLAPEWELTFATQGQEALSILEAARRENRPFALAFVDMRMPPGWDGVETIERLWGADADLEVVICTAFADYSLDQITARLNRSSQLLVLKKPFDLVEVQQLANALVAKWNLVQSERAQLESVRKAEASARAYAASLATINSALAQAKAGAESNLQAKNELLEDISTQVLAGAHQLVSAIERAQAGDTHELVLQCRALESDLELIGELSRHAAAGWQAEIRDCALPPILDTLRAVAHGPIPARIHADPDLLKRLLGLLPIQEAALEVEYLQGDRTLRWRWKGEPAALAVPRMRLIEMLCRVLSISRETAPEGIELRQSLGHVDESSLTLHPQAALPSDTAKRNETLPLSM